MTTRVLHHVTLHEEKEIEPGSGIFIALGNDGYARLHNTVKFLGYVVPWNTESKHSAFNVSWWFPETKEFKQYHKYCGTLKGSYLSLFRAGQKIVQQMKAVSR